MINFNLPDDPENYVHRSGRTGRAGKSGVSIAIIHTREMNRIRDIRRRTRIEFEQEQVPTGKDICVKQLYALIDKIVSVKVDHEQIAPFLDSIYSKLETLDREELIKHFISAEFNHFLDYYKNARDLNVKGRETRDGRRETRDGRRETRDGRRDTRDGRRDTRDGRRSSDAGRRTSFTKLWGEFG